jgi:hypothetical protein
LFCVEPDAKFCLLLLGGPLFISILEGRRGFSFLTSLKLFVALNADVDGGGVAAVLFFVAPPSIGSDGFDPATPLGLKVLGGAFEESDISRSGGVESGVLLLAGSLFSVELASEGFGLNDLLGGVNPPLALLDFAAKSLPGKLEGGFVSGGPVFGALVGGGVVEGGCVEVFAADLKLFFESSSTLSDAGRTIESSMGSCLAGCDRFSLPNFDKIEFGFMIVEVSSILPTILFLIAGFPVTFFEVLAGEKLLGLGVLFSLISSIFGDALTKSDCSVLGPGSVGASSKAVLPSAPSLSLSDSTLAICSLGPRNLVLKTAQEPSPTNVAMTTRRLINP